MPPLRLLCVVSLLPLQPALAAPGDVDTSFDPNVNGTVRALTLLPDGRLFAGGDFTTVGGVTRSRLCRFSAAGTLEAAGTFATDGPVYCLAAQAGGSVLAGGAFSIAGGETRSDLAKFTAAGTVDTGFNPGMNELVRCLETPVDSWVYAGGDFTTTGGIASNRFTRFTAGGLRDAGYFPDLASFGVFSAALLPDGKMLLGGYFTAVAGVPRQRIARLHSNGALDAAFNASADDIVRGLLIQPDGRIIICGNFAVVNGVSRTRIARLHADGALDTSFNASVAGDIYTSALQTDGRILIGGTITAVNGVARGRIARLNANGTLDTTFTASAGGNVYALLLRPDGRIDAGGQFTTINSISRNRLARLLNDPATQSLSVSTLQRVQWLRGGASPEVTAVSFDLSTNGGGAWTPLGAASRIAGGWELAGLSLPATGQVRARARALAGYGNGSSSLLETITAFTGTALEQWRQTHFGTSQNTDSGADPADPDRDGLDNLTEFALGRHPLTADSAGLPSWQPADDDYALSFPRPPGVSGITYTGEYSTSLVPGTWTPALNLSTPATISFMAPAISTRLFLRLRITVP